MIDSKARPAPDKIRELLDFPRPTTVKQLRQFIHTVNFYRRCMPNAIRYQMVLQSMISGNKKYDKNPLLWSADTDHAFVQCKQELANAVLLFHPRPDANLSIYVDASDYGIGGVLQQEHKGEIQPLGFFCKKLSGAELNYSAYDRELLAIYKSIRHFRSSVEGRVFTVYTDHKPLIYMFSKRNEKAFSTTTTAY